MTIQDYIDDQMVNTPQSMESYKTERDELRFLMKVQGSTDNEQIEEDVNKIFKDINGSRGGK